MRNEHTEARLRRRALTTMILAIFFLILGATGVVLYASPRGRVANWTDWSVLGLTKQNWSAIHITTATLILVVVVIHLILNWKVFSFYFRSSKPGNLNLKREMVVAVSVAVLFVAGTVAEIPPFSTVLWANERLKDYWEESSERAPVAHAEELAIDELSPSVGIPAEEILSRLHDAGFEAADTSARFGEIAALNGVSPNALFEVVVPHSPGSNGYGRRGAGQTREGGACDSRDSEGIEGAGFFQGAGGGAGYGRKTLKQVCLEEGIDPTEILARLRERGVEATEDQNLREIADRIGVHPKEILPSLVRVAQADVDPR
ncbi:MAG: DUF4405 domain-containing protein [Candidatus Omnitrophica bacterium]|nr:DUF4405 domain-containing protein [Candidatus Omnitrophota bacterium]